MKSELESKLEADVRKFAVRRGWWCAKFVSPGQTGVPDRMFIRRGAVVFIELKRFGKSPDPKQFAKMQEMRDHGATVYWADNLTDCMEILQ